jgi:pyridoxine 5-phosphate synthase
MKRSKDGSGGRANTEANIGATTRANVRASGGASTQKQRVPRDVALVGDTPIELGVNIDHVATVRQARRTYEPDPVWAAVEAHLGGADGITVHLREDRRHIQDHDVRRLRDLVQIKLNLEMAATEEMIKFATGLRPELAMLVPEGRHEVTTEGGLDVIQGGKKLKESVRRLKDSGIIVSVFIDADVKQIEAAKLIGADVCEIHTGPYAHAFHARRDADAAIGELERVRVAGAKVRELGMRFNAGHALNYVNVQRVAALPGVRELHIGHSIVSRAIFVGMRAAVAEMKRLMREATLMAL